ncbi:MAG TPA: hypothetical protein VFV38_02925 [Ktedonobacteraceae bacterium]|nr:hypothetical protein [Ktedonobacteraceae bacterium]
MPICWPSHGMRGQRPSAPGRYPSTAPAADELAARSGPWIIVSLMVLLFFACTGLLIWGSYQFGWTRTGFADSTSPTPQYQCGKTLWDWLQLLIVPVILAAGAGCFPWWSARTERQIAQRRSDQEQQIADQRYKLFSLI